MSSSVLKSTPFPIERHKFLNLIYIAWGTPKPTKIKFADEPIFLEEDYYNNNSKIHKRDDP